MSTAEKLPEKVDYEYLTSKLEELPTLPSIVSEISQVINDPMSTPKDIEDLMLNDQSLTTKVLKLINSAYYSIPGGIDDLGRAIGYLGYDAIYQLVLATSVFQSLKVDGEPSFDINEFWKHSIGVAIASEAIAKHVQYKNPQELFTAGLIHDIGKIAILKVEPNVLSEVCAYAAEKKITMIEAEEDLNTYKHNIVGFILTEKWKISGIFAPTIKYHHTVDTAARVGVSPEVNLAVDIVMFANIFMHNLDFGNSGYDKKLSIPPELFKRLNIQSDDIKDLAKTLKTSLHAAEHFLKVIGS
tara:strand:+ start:7894 stop:8790 length:897 start_codon:yes stop_codon:yes gene_type:complete